MKTIESILEKYERPPELLGSEPVKKELLAELNEEKKLCNRIYGALFAVVCLITLISVAAVIADLVAAKTRRILVLSAAGISMPFMLNYMRRAAEQWSQLSLLITLVSHSDEKAVQALIKKLLSSKAVGLAASASKG